MDLVSPSLIAHGRRRFEASLLGFALLLISLISGPGHLIHHAADCGGGSGSGAASHECLACAVFAHLPFIHAAAAVVPEEGAASRTIPTPTPAVQTVVPRTVLAARAPPLLSA